MNTIYSLKNSRAFTYHLCKLLTAFRCMQYDNSNDNNVSPHSDKRCSLATNNA